MKEKMKNLDDVKNGKKKKGEKIERKLKTDEMWGGREVKKITNFNQWCENSNNE